jgi:predicted dehydrogenase
VADRGSDVSSVVRIAQVGLRGFGTIHLERVDRLAAMGRVELVACADPAGPLEGRGVPWYAGLTELLANHEVDIVTIATPIGTHYALACEALAAGADVMLEKPPVASLDDFWLLLEAERASGRSIQIGFQALGSDALARVRELAADIGELTNVQIWGMWLRDNAYYGRAAWAGKRVMNGRRVADGVCTNPLAHSFATAFALVGLTDISQIESIETELYHAHDIEADDTSWVKIRRTDGVPIDVSLTLCGPVQEEPTVTLVGTKGRVTLTYTTDDIAAEIGLDWSVGHTGRTDLLENLVDHRESGVPLLVPLANTVGFMALLEATQTAPDPVAIEDTYIEWRGTGDFRYPVVHDIDAWQLRCLAEGKGYADAGAPWASQSAKSIWTPPPRPR